MYVYVYIYTVFRGFPTVFFQQGRVSLLSPPVGPRVPRGSQGARSQERMDSWLAWNVEEVAMWSQRRCTKPPEQFT